MEEIKRRKMMGKQSVQFENPPYIIAGSSVAGKKEKEGPLGSLFDQIIEETYAGQSTWEQEESSFQELAVVLAMKKAKLKESDIRYLIGGDLLGQMIATSFGISDLNIPFFGVYGACSTMGESMALASMLVEGGFADRIAALTSSHFGGAEKQFRFPLDYGNQRPLAATWTVTGSGAVIIGEKKEAEEKRKKGDQCIAITGVTTGKIVDYGIKDSMNMGACMAPAAADVIYNNLNDFAVTPDYYDQIITGDLGYVGKDILVDIMKEKGFDISKNHMDCGIEIFCKEEQDTHSGGSGCGCSAITLTAYVLPKITRGEWKRVLFVPTGALLSPVSFNEGKSVPGIAHGIQLEGR